MCFQKIDLLMGYAVKKQIHIVKNMEPSSLRGVFKCLFETTGGLSH